MTLEVDGVGAAGAAVGPEDEDSAGVVADGVEVVLRKTHFWGIRFGRNANYGVQYERDVEARREEIKALTRED